MKTIIIILIAVVFLFFIIYFLVRKNKKNKKVTTSTTTKVPVLTTTKAPKPYYTWYVTESVNHGCGDEVGSTPYYTSEIGYNLITKFFINSGLTVVYKPGSGTIGFSKTSGPITKATHVGNIDSDGNINNISNCPN